MHRQKQTNYKTILVVDDEPNVRAALKRLLHYLPYQVLTATNGAEAVKTAETQQPDLILLDIRMPVMDGFQALKEIRNLGLEMPVVMLTAETEMMRGYLEGAAYYIMKPFKNEHVTNIIEYLVGEPSENRKVWLETHI